MADHLPLQRPTADPGTRVVNINDPERFPGFGTVVATGEGFCNEGQYQVKWDDTGAMGIHRGDFLREVDPVRDELALLKAELERRKTAMAVWWEDHKRITDEQRAEIDRIRNERDLMAEAVTAFYLCVRDGDLFRIHHDCTVIANRWMHPAGLKVPQ